MNEHHVVLGNAIDYITGNIITDTHDEQYRQKIAKFLVKHCLYEKKQITKGEQILVFAGKKRAVINIDFLIHIADQIVMVIKYAPGSIITRHRMCLALSRIVTSYQIPFAVVANGKDADILDGFSGKVIGRGLESIPHRSVLEKIVKEHTMQYINSRHFEMESRIVYTYEVDDSCICDSNICKIN